MGLQAPQSTQLINTPAFRGTPVENKVRGGRPSPRRDIGDSRRQRRS